MYNVFARGKRLEDIYLHDLVSSWAYMMIGAARELKAWLDLLMLQKILERQVVWMEFKRFLDTSMKISCLIVKTGRQIIYRLVGYNLWIKRVPPRVLGDQRLSSDVKGEKRDNGNLICE